MFEDIRSKMMTAYSTLHVASYPTLPVNYPGRVNYDPSEKSDPFVIVAIRFNPTRQLSLGQRNLKASGDLLVQYYFRPNTGMKQSTDFSDFLLDKFAMRTISGIIFRELSIYIDAGREGWEGTLNVIPFQTEYFNV